MTEVIGDIVAPSEFILPQKTTTEANAFSGASMQSGVMIFNTTLGKAEVYIKDIGWETITSAAR